MGDAVLVPFQKLVPKCKHRFRKTVIVRKGQSVGPTLPVEPMEWKEKCQRCGDERKVRGRSPIKKVSAKRRKRIGAWPSIRKAVFEYCEGICFWCKRWCPLEKGTAEHAEPDDGGKNTVETNLNWVHNWPFPSSCHGAKSYSGNYGIVIALHASVERYRKHGYDRPLPDPSKLPKEELSVERAECNIYLAMIQARIERGEIPRSQGWPC